MRTDLLEDELVPDRVYKSSLRLERTELVGEDLPTEPSLESRSIDRLGLEGLVDAVEYSGNGHEELSSSQ